MADLIPNPSGTHYLLLYDENGGEAYQIQGSVDSTNNFLPDNLSATGLSTTTAGVTDTTDKRFVTDAELSFLAAAAALTAGETKLSTTASIDLNTAAETTLYTVPTGKSCIITRVVIRAASASLTTASISFGFNAGTDTDVIANSTYTALTGATLYSVVNAKAGAKVGTSTGVFAVKVNTPQGSAATATVDVFGYIY